MIGIYKLMPNSTLEKMYSIHTIAHCTSRVFYGFAGTLLKILDEPTSALDPISTSKIEDLAMDLRGQYTIVIVTHNMQQAVRISDNTAFFLLGEMVEFGDTKKLFSKPADKRTEDYITGRFG